MQTNSLKPVDIDNLKDWGRLAASDPAAFEAMRQQIIDNFINSAPVEKQQRLRGLQWQVDMVRSRSPNPLACCIAISKMMWDSVDRFTRLQREVAGMARGPHPVRPHQTRPLAQVLPFPTQAP